MFIKIKDININYVQYGKGKDVILLHGWGQNIDMMTPIGNRLKNKYRITIIDLPGFGQSEEPTFSWTIYDYYDMLCELIEHLKIKRPTIVGHSFGGRIGIIYAAYKDIDKLVLLAAPFEKTVVNMSILVRMFRWLKKVPIINKLEHVVKKYIGSKDYRLASNIMRQILVNTINEDLTECVKKIECPTLLIWGSNDTVVSLESAKRLEALIKDSGLIVYEGLSHYAYLENIDQTVAILNNFLSNKKE
ncbi:MAG: alpha/beta fold hydrolase [Bacilli bacterium]|jgi:pimeloyl-ACP methyl ester carboxylesterase